MLSQGWLSHFAANNSSKRTREKARAPLNSSVRPVGEQGGQGDARLGKTLVSDSYGCAWCGFMRRADSFVTHVWYDSGSGPCLVDHRHELLKRTILAVWVHALYVHRRICRVWLARLALLPHIAIA